MSIFILLLDKFTGDLSRISKHVNSSNSSSSEREKKDGQCAGELDEDEDEERRAYRVDLGTDELEHDSSAPAGHVPERDAPRRCLLLTPAAADIGARW